MILSKVARPSCAEAAEMEIAAQSSALLLKQQARLRRVLTPEDLVRCMFVIANYVIQKCVSCLVYADA